ncbi:MAG: cyclic nucleotide-binding domain-containing protein [Acidobacteria bacterium]|nr:cyclic nucleotide-binding domain-containing protein [Acidobacteriota bacterium]MBV9069137.1 cyclic nucleotide-binding domain-containing protein [Acidobacteriota bacterium]MBV9185349.1 cyclic nucleotide-binding domain-containing protein [Acidobacteriota bacterium]
MKTVFKTTGGKDPVKDSSAHYAAGDVIFQQGELGTEMFIIQEGEVNIVKHINGESHALSHLEKGDFFGEMAVLESVPRTADAIAATDVRALVINGARFDEMLRKNPEVAVRIIRKYSKRLREANTLLERLVGREVDSEHGALDATQSVPAEVHHRHRLVDATTGAEFFFSKGDETTIGRADPVTGILPDIDLTPVDANRSVSRRHAKIICSGNQYFMLEEVGTVNGTYVNDQRIPTGTPVMIHNGDGIKIGLIAMRALFD